MKVTVTKLTGIEHARRAIETTVRGQMKAKASLKMIYLWMHSPIRTQMFEIYMEGIPSFVATHFVRHAHMTPFITTCRTDRGGSNDLGRMAPVDMRMFINAESLITMAGKRLCFQSSRETRMVMEMLRIRVGEIDPDLEDHMVPNCVLQGGYCREPKICGKYPYVKRYDPQRILKGIQDGDFT